MLADADSVAAAHHGIPPDEYRASFRAAAEAGALPADLADRLAPAAGMRDGITHMGRSASAGTVHEPDDYPDTDLALLVAGVSAAPADFDAYVAAVAGWLDGLARER